MKAKLLKDCHYPAAWVFRFKPIKAGTVVPVIPASNIPGKGRYWINTVELQNDPYGILLEPGDYEVIKNLSFKAVPYRLGLPCMNKSITFDATDFTDARHWVINHLDLSENYNIIKA